MLQGSRERFLAALVGLIATAPLTLGVTVWAREGLAGLKEQLERKQLTA